MELTEGLDPKDLVDRVKPEVHFDEFGAKMGTDDDVIVASFKIMGQAAASDLETFLEKGYDWILDAETSAGEIEDSYYLVFIEAERRSDYPKKFMSLLSDLKNITDIEDSDWTMLPYLGTKKDPRYNLTQNNIATHVPLSPKKYRDNKAANDVMEGMLNIARVPRTLGDIDEFRATAKRLRG
jgi:hypothetical protein|tara:strand:+ start:655 stop:1200 length:546 start_codon:yes stop_codon:yes gene_type:complete